MKHPQIPLRSSSTASTSASAKTRFLDYLLDSCSGPKQSKTVTSLLSCVQDGNTFSPTFQQVASSNVVTSRLVDHAHRQIAAASRAAVKRVSNRLKTDISLQVDRAYAPLEDSEHDVAEQPAGDTALEESDNVSTRASPTGGESVGTVSSNAVERKVDAEGTHETNSRATPMDISHSPVLNKGER